MLKWVYTDSIECGGELTPEEVDSLLDLMRAAARFMLPTLTTRCGQLLMPAVNVETCVRIINVAHDLHAVDLKTYVPPAPAHGCGCGCGCGT
jgi:hypothetical protein